MILVKNEEKYYNFIRILRNDPSNQVGFLEKVNISESEQKKYMDSHGNCYYICLIDNVPCGYVGVVNNDIRVCVDEKYKNKGIGYFMISEIIKIYPEATAKILKTNINSLLLFKKSGYKIIDEDDKMFYLEYGV